jgi:hypothetical protein
MKIYLLATILVISAAIQPAFANENEIRQVEELSYKNNILSGSYMIGGGCENHQPAIDVKLVKQPDEYNFKIYRAVITILDVTPKADYCEGVLFVKFKFNLKEEIDKKMQSQGLDLTTTLVPSIDLPEVGTR